MEITNLKKVLILSGVSGNMSIDRYIDRCLDRCLFQTHTIGTAYICRSIHIKLQHFNTRQ